MHGTRNYLIFTKSNFVKVKGLTTVFLYKRNISKKTWQLICKSLDFPDLEISWNFLRDIVMTRYRTKHVRCELQILGSTETTFCLFYVAKPTEKKWFHVTNLDFLSVEKTVRKTLKIPTRRIYHQIYERICELWIWNLRMS